MAQASATTIPVRANLALAALQVAVNGYQFFILPIALLPASPWWALTVIPLAALNNPLWSLVHETIHGNFHPSSRTNQRAGRVLGVAFCSPWQLVRVGHLLHHRFNRTPLNRLEDFDPARRSRRRTIVRYYYHLLIGLYVAQLLSALAFYLPRHVLLWARGRFLRRGGYDWNATTALTRPEALLRMRIDGTVIYLLLGTSLYFYGAYWWVVAAILAMRGFCISFLDYIYHYESRLDELLHADNLHLPRPVAALLLNFNLHGVHHRHPSLPWRALPDAFRRDGDRYHGDYAQAAVRQFRGPIAVEQLALLRDRVI